MAAMPVGVGENTARPHTTFDVGHGAGEGVSHLQFASIATAIAVAEARFSTPIFS